MKTVAIYSTPTCHYCQLAKEFFKENNVEYTEYNVAEDTDKRKEMVDVTGQMGVPVIMVMEEGKDPETVIGFNEDKLRSILDL